MREIKFRAWESNNMYYQVRVGGMFDNMATSPTTWNGNEWVNLTGGKYTIIMQYTGLKDKNGKEIYEGDILAKDGYWSIRIEYDKGCFMVRDLDKVRYINLITNIAIFYWEISEWEVIGNIYENPELLEGVNYD